jgi:predicted ATPase
VRILATARQRLGILGEMTWRVPSMSLPTVDTPDDALQECDAARLLVERAAARAPESCVCATNWVGFRWPSNSRRPRITVLAVDQIAAHPNDSIRLLTTGNRTAPPRQQTLEATFDWSYRLLDPERADSPDGLAVFAGSWALEAAEAVCADAAIAAADVLDVLARLIEQPLVLAEAGCQSRRPRPGR